MIAPTTAAPDTTTYDCEITDTFGGEANYSWVRRETIVLPATATDRSVVRAAKAALGITGVRCRTSDMGEGWELRPYGMCQVAFITPAIDPGDPHSPNHQRCPHSPCNPGRKMTKFYLTKSDERELGPWITVEGHCATRVLKGTDPDQIANRVAFIEKTPRVRTSPYTSPDAEGGKWESGPKGRGGGCPSEDMTYGFDPDSRKWCDEKLLAQGYILS